MRRGNFGFSTSPKKGRDPGPFLLSFGSQMQESPLHRIDLGEICFDVVIAATLPWQQAEATARECLRRTCAAQMNDRS